MPEKLILLVEDDENDELMTIAALRDGGVTANIEVVRDGQEALDWLFCEGEHSGRDPGTMPELIMLDIRLPRRSGLEVLQAIRSDQRTRRIPVVMLTSSDEWSDLARSYDLFANSYVRKPVQFADYQRVVARLGKYWTECNETGGRVA